MKIYVLVLLSMFKQINFMDAFTRPCPASLKTVERVAMCPSNELSYERAARRKNCSSYASDAEACQSFEYHCVLSDNLNYAVEVCAPSIKIIGNVCAKFSPIHKSIIRIDGLDCKNASIVCPWAYNSTFAFKYATCFKNISGQSTTEIILSTEPETGNKSSKNGDELKMERNLFWIMLGCCLCVLILLMVLFSCKRQGRRNLDVTLKWEEPLLQPGCVDSETADQRECRGVILLPVEDTITLMINERIDCNGVHS